VVPNRFGSGSHHPGLPGQLDFGMAREWRRSHAITNGLPAPKGPFNRTMRLYGPKSEALTWKWNPPPVTREAPRLLPAQ
jgi:hypothetical protein